MTKTDDWKKGWETGWEDGRIDGAISVFQKLWKKDVASQSVFDAAVEVLREAEPSGSEDERMKLLFSVIERDGTQAKQDPEGIIEDARRIRDELTQLLGCAPMPQATENTDEDPEPFL